MDYQIAFKPQASRDLDDLPAGDRVRVIQRIHGMRRDLEGDVKRLANFIPRYRLRVGVYRVLFEVEGSTVTIYRVLHRRDAYR